MPHALNPAAQGATHSTLNFKQRRYTEEKKQHTLSCNKRNESA